MEAKEVAREGDSVRTGHLCTYTTTIGATYGNEAKVFANSIPVACVLDPTTLHTIGIEPICVAVCQLPIVTGSSTVFVGPDRVPIARLGDTADLGSIIGGSGDVLAGG